MIKNLGIFISSLSAIYIVAIIALFALVLILLEIWRRIAKAKRSRLEYLTRMVDRANAGDASSQRACDHSEHIKQELIYPADGEPRVHYFVSKKWF